VSRKFFTIKNCEFSYQCPRAWERLATTDIKGERYCDACQRTVHLCEDDSTLNRRLAAGHCVAVEDKSRGEILVGQVSPEYSAPTDQEASPPKVFAGLKIAPPIYGTRVDPNGKINWD
jgi:hypothetical protein